MDGGGQNPESRNPDSITAGVLLPSVICEEERIAGNHIFFLPAVKGLHCTARNALVISTYRIDSIQCQSLFDRRQAISFGKFRFN
ncbi:hypothetical protein M513_09940 [Trichuris suis]|uniref:Uncharacterized protein n=1 Tax=Trichuris suis TaxID=68888 RepID=A0A085LW72_9BILA|nr:hypothetical protein M513_09940 [Trichuris suis]